MPPEPRSKADLAELSDPQLQGLAQRVGVAPQGSKGELVDRIEEAGVDMAKRKQGDVDKGGVDTGEGGVATTGTPEPLHAEVKPDEKVDVDAVVIDDSTAGNLPADHPSSGKVAPEKIHAPDQVDERPTADHRPPEA